ncbi:MAG: hypothetical protein SF029_09555 [bacterium]|nr:hypothetical protein [bacterium]
MLRKQGWMVVALLVLLLMFGSVGAWAQDDCGLAESDCALLAESDAVMAQLGAAAFKLDTTFALEYFLLPESYTFRAVVDGVYSIPPEENIASDDVLKLLRNLNSSVVVMMEVPAIDGVPLLPAGFDDMLTLDLSLVDGIGYANFDKLAQVDSTFPSGWYGVDLLEFYSTLLALVGDQGTPAITGEVDALTRAITETSTYSRIDDQQRGGQTLAVYELSGSMADVLADSRARDALEDYVLTTLESSFEGLYTYAELLQASEIYTTLAERITYRLTRIVGEDDAYLHRFEFSLLFQPDSQTLLDLNNVVDPLGLAALIFDIRLDVALDLSSFNEVPLVEAPANAELIPLEDLLPGITDEGGF